MMRVPKNEDGQEPGDLAGRQLPVFHTRLPHVNPQEIRNVAFMDSPESQCADPTSLATWRESGRVPEDDQCPTPDLNAVLGGLCDAVRWFAAPEMTPELFRDCLVTFERRRLERLGFELLSEVADDGTLWLNLCARDEGAWVATLRVNPRTGAAIIQ
jgi:hypothetical protein